LELTLTDGSTPIHRVDLIFQWSWGLI
jgi:hypothetical protein